MFLCHVYTGQQLLSLPVCFSGLQDRSKRVFSIRKKIAPTGAIFFLFELTPFDKRGKNEYGKVDSPESVSIPLKFFGHLNQF